MATFVFFKQLSSWISDSEQFCKYLNYTACIFQNQEGGHNFNTNFIHHKKKVHNKYFHCHPFTVSHMKICSWIKSVWDTNIHLSVTTVHNFTEYYFNIQKHKQTWRLQTTMVSCSQLLIMHTYNSSFRNDTNNLHPETYSLCSI